MLQKLLLSLLNKQVSKVPESYKTVKFATTKKLEQLICPIPIYENNKRIIIC